MIDKQWALEQIKRKFIAYLRVCADSEGAVDGYERRKAAHLSYARVMWGYQDLLGITSFEVSVVCAEAKSEGWYYTPFERAEMVRKGR